MHKAIDRMDLDLLRERLRRMSDAELMRFGEAATSVCSSKATEGTAPKELFRLQLEETKVEWKRRHSAA